MSAWLSSVSVLRSAEIEEEQIKWNDAYLQYDGIMRRFIALKEGLYLFMKTGSIAEISSDKCQPSGSASPRASERTKHYTTFNYFNFHLVQDIKSRKFSL